MAQIIELTLPASGRRAALRRPTGRDMVEADRLAGRGAGDFAGQLALMSRIAMIDGRVLPYEDIQDMDLEDIGAMLKVDFSAGAGHGPPGAPPGASWPSHVSPDGP